MNADKESIDQIAEKIIGAAFEVSNTLGVGFLEKVYEKALMHEMTLRGMKVESQTPLNVQYKGVHVGEYFSDLIVENCVIVEIKCARTFAPEHTAQCLNYLRATGIKLALLINFQKPRVEIKRIALNL